MTCFLLSFPVTLSLTKDTSMKEELKSKLQATRQSLAAIARDISYNQHFKTDNGISKDEGIALNVVANHLMRLYHLIEEVLDCKEGEKPQFDIDSANLLLFSGIPMRDPEWKDGSSIIGVRFVAKKTIEEKYTDVMDVLYRNGFKMTGERGPCYLVMSKDEEVTLYQPEGERYPDMEIAPPIRL